MTDRLAEIQRFEDGGVQVVAISGEIDLSNVESLRLEITAELTARGPLVLDLAEVVYIDSVGIAMLDRLGADTSSTHIVAPSESHTGRLLAMVALGLPLHDSRAEAITAAGEASGGPPPV